MTSPPTPIEQVLTMPAVSLSTASRALGISVATGSRHAANGTFPVPVIRMGSRVIVPTPKLRALLQLDVVSEVA